jgi:hypothetical protein
VKKETWPMKGFPIAAVFFVIAALLAGCRKPANDPAIEQMLRANMQYAQNEDRAAYMATISPTSPIRAMTEKMLAQVFRVYDLKYDIESIELLSNDGRTATVRVVQTTRKVSGPVFRDNRLRVTNELRKVDGKWTIYNSKMEKMEYLN